jgi:hypothetical protein
MYIFGTSLGHNAHTPVREIHNSYWNNTNSIPVKTGVCSVSGITVLRNNQMTGYPDIILVYVTVSKPWATYLRSLLISYDNTIKKSS